MKLVHPNLVATTLEAGGPKCLKYRTGEARTHDPLAQAQQVGVVVGPARAGVEL